MQLSWFGEIIDTEFSRLTEGTLHTGEDKQMLVIMSNCFCSQDFA
jgi:hypothetical protein